MEIKGCNNCHYHYRSEYEFPCYNCVASNDSAFWEPGFAVVGKTVLKNIDHIQWAINYMITSKDGISFSIIVPNGVDIRELAMKEYKRIAESNEKFIGDVF